MKIKQNGGVQQALNVVNSCKPFHSKILFIMQSVHDIVNIAKTWILMFQQILQLNHPINLPIICEDPKNT